MTDPAQLLRPLAVPSGWPRGAVVCQTRRGRSADRYGDFNLGLHVGDDLAKVGANRSLLAAAGVPAVAWLEQVHGAEVVRVDDPVDSPPAADAAFTTSRHTAVAVMTADCLPVVLSNRQGSEIAAVHCGWRGLQAGVLEAAIGEFGAEEILAAFGPAIGPCHYEVGEEVAAHFRDVPGAVQVRGGRLYADLFTVACARLRARGVACGPRAACTHCAKDLYSYRRDGVTGRQAVIAWLGAPAESISG